MESSEVSTPTKYSSILDAQRATVIAFVKSCAEECRLNEKDVRRPQNLKNWAYFHGNVDWSHKKPGEPKIHLHKIGVAAERMRSKFKQALMNYDRWLDVVREYPNPDASLTSFAAKSLLIKQLKRADAKTRIADAVLNGCIESRMAVKVSGKYVTNPRLAGKGLVDKEKQVWQLDLPVLSFEKFLPDSIDADFPLYVIEEFRTDHYRVLDMGNDEEDDVDPNKPFRYEACEMLGNFTERTQEQATKVAEGNTIKMDQLKGRNQNLIQNFYGTILDDKGEIMKWENKDGEKFELRNIFCVVGNEAQLLMDPQRNTRLSAKHPYVYCDPLRSPGTGRKGLLDAGTDLNHADDELFSLMLAGAIKSVHNVTWYRKSWIANKSALSGGLKDGSSLELNDSAPAGMDPVGTCTTGKVPMEALTMKGMLDSTFAENVISNQIDLSGNLPGKQVRATELTQAASSISDVFDSMAGDVEEKFIEPLAEEAFFEIIQHLDDMDEDEVKSCWGPDQDKAEEFMKKTPKQRVAEVLGAFRFEGRGLHSIIANASHAQTLINLLNAITANPITQGAVESQVSAAKIILELANNMGIDIEKIQPDQRERDMIDQKQLIAQQAMQQAAMMQGGAQGGPGGPPSPSQGSQPQSGMVPGNGQQGF